MKIELSAPRGWGDLTLDQFRDIAKLMCLQLTREELLIVAFCQLTGVKRLERNDFVTSEGIKFTLSDRQVQDLCDGLKWLLDEIPEHVANPSGADEYLRSMSFGDYYEADCQMRMYEADRDVKHFDNILPKFGETPRIVEDYDATMYLIWWNSISMMLKDRYPHVFADSVNGSTMRDAFGVLQDIHAMLDDDRPQDDAAIDETNLHSVFNALENRIIKAKRDKEGKKR